MNSRPLTSFGRALALAGCSVCFTFGSQAVASGVRHAAQTGSDPYAAGQKDLHVGKYAAAEAAFRQAIRRHEHLAAAYAGLGAAALAHRDYSTAYSSYRHAASLAPKNADYQYGAGYAALYTDDFHGVERYTTAYIVLKPRDPRGYHLQFLAAGALLDPKLQIKDASAEARLLPHNAGSFNDLGIALANRKNYKRAIVAFDHAIRLNASVEQYYNNRGLAEFRAKEYAAALHDLQRARALSTNKVRRAQLAKAIAELRGLMHH